MTLQVRVVMLVHAGTRLVVRISLTSCASNSILCLADATCQQLVTCMATPHQTWNRAEREGEGEGEGGREGGKKNQRGKFAQEGDLDLMTWMNGHQLDC